MTTASHSLLPRAERLHALSTQQFDVLVIGGGITGSGVARDAALRGLKVALVEREDFGSGTSSRSSRLIHGGLRYLEHGHLRLVFEASTERRLLLKLAPHLVRPLGFTWPVYKGARVPRWKLNAGLMLYDALALFRNVKGHAGLSVRQVTEREPMLRTEGLTGGARYYDAATDDARLTVANALGAAEAGATVLNHVKVSGLVFEEGGKARGAEGIDTLTGRSFRVSARAVVNATGPWTEEVRRMEQQPGSTALVRGSKGVHLAVPRERIGNQEALTLLSAVDGRVYFVLPSGAHAIIGTTETATSAHPAEVRATESDVAYLLESANAFFPNARLTRADVVSAWAGIRPLAATGYDAKGSANSASREHVVSVSPSGVVGISGGKLTTFRVMAADVVDAVERGLALPHCDPTTAEVPLPGGDFASVPAEREAALEALGGAGMEESAAHLVASYGSRWREVLALTRERPELALPIVDGLPYLCAEAVYAVRSELAETLADILIRRTKVAFETRDMGVGASEAVAPMLGWSEEERARQLESYRLDAERIFRIEPAEAKDSAANEDQPQRAAS